MANTPRFAPGDKDYIYKLNQMGEAYDDAVSATGSAAESAALAEQHKNDTAALYGSAQALLDAETRAAESAAASQASAESVAAQLAQMATSTITTQTLILQLHG